MPIIHWQRRRKREKALQSQPSANERPTSLRERFLEDPWSGEDSIVVHCHHRGLNKRGNGYGS